MYRWDEKAGLLIPSIHPGKKKLLLVVRDLASGLMLAGVPAKGERADVVCKTLRALFAAHGAPLVIKHDNGSGFRAKVTQRLMEEHEVHSLPSPAYRPQYNGTIERSIGWVKLRAENIAKVEGHREEWTEETLERARDQANTLRRPWGRKGPTPYEAFARRRPITKKQRQAFKRTVDDHIQAQLETHADELGRIITDTPYEVMERRAIVHALAKHGYLKIRRGRISTPVSESQPDRIS